VTTWIVTIRATTEIWTTVLATTTSWSDRYQYYSFPPFSFFFFFSYCL
jgi:hypothetical protein